MKQKLFIFLILVLLIVLLVGLNAATYVQKEKVPDTELMPNRSTYNSGTTGTQAFYSLLSETGRNVVRWRSSLETIASETDGRPSVFVMIGPLLRPLNDQEKTQLMEWVSNGGTLILIDREPAPDIAMTTSQWKMSVAPKADPGLFSIDTSDQKQMTADTPAQKPQVPSYISHGVNAVQASRLASSIELERYEVEGSEAIKGFRPVESPTATPFDFYGSEPLPPPPPPPVKRAEADPQITGAGADEESSDDDVVDEGPLFQAPIVHVGGSGRNILVEAPFAEGRVIILSDPYIVSNAGISLVDNSRLAVNLVAAGEGLVAFDEYHHGHGATNNRLFAYFEGTPVIAMFLQFGLLLALVFFSQSRRFARPVPRPEPSRLSKLEYVSAMAELQERTRAFDLAIENIYADFRRRASMLLGLDNTIATRTEIAQRVAERIGENAKEIESLMFKCEDIIRGEPVGKKETVGVIESIRKIEERLGLKRAGRKGV